MQARVPDFPNHLQVFQVNQVNPGDAVGVVCLPLWLIMWDSFPAEIWGMRLKLDVLWIPKRA
jgi:hypothetical protein